MAKTATIRGIEYTLLYEFKIVEVFRRRNKRTRWKSILISVLIVALGFLSGLALGRFLGKTLLSANAFVLLTVLLCTFVLHEAIHGFFFRVFGGKPKFGIKVLGGWRNFLWGLVLYATADALYTRSQYVVIGLSPLVLISVLAVAASLYGPLQAYALLAGLANALGAVGDIYMTAKLAKFPPGVMVRDTPEGYEIYQSATATLTDVSAVA